MRKNKTMRVAALLLALVLMTSCFVGGTFAKYVTKYEANDNTRIAYWGFDAAAKPLTFDMFDAEYVNADGEVSVKSALEDNVIAPGTEKTVKINFEYVNTTIGGQAITAPEVDYTLKFELKATQTDGSALSAAQAELLKQTRWEVYTDDFAEGGFYDTFENVASMLGMYLGSASEVVHKAGTLPDALTKECDLAWQWAFADGSDEMDTWLGNQSPNIAPIMITLTITATQVD